MLLRLSFWDAGVGSPLLLSAGTGMTRRFRYMRVARRFLQRNFALRIPFGKLGDQRRDSRPDGDDLLAVRACDLAIAERRLAVCQLDVPCEVAHFGQADAFSRGQCNQLDSGHRALMLVNGVPMASKPRLS
jgi:hypothetical protein